MFIQFHDTPKFHFRDFLYLKLISETVSKPSRDVLERALVSEHLEIHK